MSKRKRILAAVLLITSVLLAAGKAVRENEEHEDHGVNHSDNTDCDDCIYDDIDFDNIEV